MKILKMLQKQKTGNRCIDEFSDSPISVECWKTGKIKDYTLDANEEWVLSAQIEIKFWANRAQFDDAIKIAERALIARLYDDILCELPELRLALMNGNRRAALAICDKIEKKLSGEN